MDRCFKLLLLFIAANIVFCSDLYAGRTGMTHKEAAQALRLAAREARHDAKLFAQVPRERVPFVQLYPDLAKFCKFVPQMPRVAVSVSYINRRMAFNAITYMMLFAVILREGCCVQAAVQEGKEMQANEVPDEFAPYIRQFAEIAEKTRSFDSQIHDPSMIFGQPIHACVGRNPIGVCLNKEKLQQWIDASELSALSQSSQICCEARQHYTFECCLHSDASGKSYCGFVGLEGVIGDDSGPAYDTRAGREAEVKMCTDRSFAYHVRAEAKKFLPTTRYAPNLDGLDSLVLEDEPQAPFYIDIDKVTLKDGHNEMCGFKLYKITKTDFLPSLMSMVREIARLSNVPMPDVAVYDDAHCPRALQRGYSFCAGTRTKEGREENFSEVRCSFELLRNLYDGQHTDILAHEVGGHGKQFNVSGGPLNGQTNPLTKNLWEAEADMYRTWIVANVCDQLGWDIGEGQPVQEITRDNQDVVLQPTDGVGHPSNLARQVLGLQFKHNLKRFVWLVVRMALKKDE